MSKKRKLKQLEEELETYKERLEEGLKNGEEWTEDYLRIAKKLEKAPGDTSEAVEELPKEERKTFVKASRKIYIV